jgi:hypothetical protein
LDDYPIKILEHKLVISLMIENFESTTRLFTYFDSYIDFFEYSRQFPSHERSFYEVIFGEAVQKPHFDLDLDLKDVLALYPNGDLDLIADTLVEHLISGCLEAIVGLDLRRDILIYSSHSETKRSYHLIINHWCHDNHQEARAFYDLMVTKISEATDGKYLEFLDSKVYSTLQQFRLVGSQKLGSNRPKVFNERFYFRGQEYLHQYEDSDPDPEIKSLGILYESLITCTSGCQSLPSWVVEDDRYFDGSFPPSPELNEEEVEACLILMKEVMHDPPFAFKTKQDGLLLLERLAPSMCPLCYRIHEHISPYMFTVYDKLYWDCRRSPTGSKKYFLGYLPIYSFPEETKDVPREPISSLPSNEVREDLTQTKEENRIIIQPQIIGVKSRLPPSEPKEIKKATYSPMITNVRGTMDQIIQNHHRAKEEKKRTECLVGQGLFSFTAL